MKKIIARLFLFILILSCSKSKNNIIVNEENPTQNEIPETNTPVENPTLGIMRDISSIELASFMGSGWNLGNSLDALGPDETFWGNPITTKIMIDVIKDRGFKTIRIPVSWGRHMGDEPNYIIEQAWLDRVQEVVDYAVANDFYIILNSHHEGEWVLPTYNEADEVKNRLSKLWTQIANRFKNYSDYVIFETLNEPRLEGSPEEWNGGTAEGRDVVNQYNKTSVDAIRATGGNNLVRHLLIPTYAASALPVTMNTLIIPNNDERVMVSIHNYFPWDFCGREITDPLSIDTWGTQVEKDAMDASLNMIRDTFITNGRAVIMGEWGSINKDNTADRLAHATYFANACATRKMTPLYWDNGGDFRLFDRQTSNWVYIEIADAIINATK